MSLLITSVLATKPNRKPILEEWWVRLLIESLDKLEHEYKFFGPDENIVWTGSKDIKLKYLTSKIRTIQHSHVMFVDGADSFLAAPSEEIIDKFEALNHKIVISAELQLHPNAGRFPEFYHEREPEENQTYEYRYLNAGGVIARTEDYADALEYLVEHLDEYTALQHELEMGKKVAKSDQSLWQFLYCSPEFDVHIDHQCSIFQTFGVPQQPNHQAAQRKNMRWDPEKLRFRNRITGEYPCHFHFNGRYKKVFGEYYRRWNPTSKYYSGESDRA